MNNDHHRHRYTLLYLWLAVIVLIYLGVVVGGVLIARFLVLFLAGAV